MLTSRPTSAAPEGRLKGLREPVRVVVVHLSRHVPRLSVSASFAEPRVCRIAAPIDLKRTSDPA